MDGSSLIFIVMPIVILLALFTLVALPVIADRQPRSGHRRARPGLAARPAVGPGSEAARVRPRSMTAPRSASTT